VASIGGNNKAGSCNEYEPEKLEILKETKGSWQLLTSLQLSRVWSTKVGLRKLQRCGNLLVHAMPLVAVLFSH
jgi:hypothetical protein